GGVSAALAGPPILCGLASTVRLWRRLALCATSKRHAGAEHLASRFTNLQNSQPQPMASRRLLLSARSSSVAHGFDRSVTSTASERCTRTLRNLVTTMA